MKNVIQSKIRARLFSFAVATFFTYALVGGVNTANGIEHFDPCAGLTGVELEKCRAFQQKAEEIITKITVHQLVVETLKRTRCLQETRDWELCWGIYRIPKIPTPGPEPGPFVERSLDKLSAANRRALFQVVREQLRADHKRELQYLKELMSTEPK